MRMLPIYSHSLPILNTHLTLRHGLTAELDEHNAGVLIVNLDGQRSGNGRELRADDITRGLERKDDGCTIM